MGVFVPSEQAPRVVLAWSEGLTIDRLRVGSRRRGSPDSLGLPRAILAMCRHLGMSPCRIDGLG